MRAQIPLVLLGTITLMGCETMTGAGERVGEFSANRINAACKMNSAYRARARANVVPYLDKGVWYTLTCPDTVVAKR